MSIYYMDISDSRDCTNNPLRNAEFYRIARRDKKAFLSNQCKEIEGKNGMGKTRDLFKKSRNIKGKVIAKMGSKRTEMVGT